MAESPQNPCGGRGGNAGSRARAEATLGGRAGVRGWLGAESGGETPTFGTQGSGGAGHAADSAAFGERLSVESCSTGTVERARSPSAEVAYRSSATRLADAARLGDSRDLRRIPPITAHPVAINAHDELREREDMDRGVGTVAGHSRSPSPSLSGAHGGVKSTRSKARRNAHRTRTAECAPGEVRAQGFWSAQRSS